MMLEPCVAYRSCIAVTKNHNLKHCKESNNNKKVINKIKPLRDTNNDVAKAQSDAQRRFLCGHCHNIFWANIVIFHPKHPK